MPKDRVAPTAPAHGAAATPRSGESDGARERYVHEIQVLRDTIDVYRTGASALAVRVSDLRTEVARLSAALHADHKARGILTIEVTLTLDDYTEDLVRAIVV